MNVQTQLARCSNTYSFPPLKSFDDVAHKVLSGVVKDIYKFCISFNQGFVIGDPSFTLVYDLSKKHITIITDKGEEKNLNKVTATPYSMKGTCISLEWKFDIEGKEEIYRTGRTGMGISGEFLNGNEHERIFPNVSMFPMVPKEFWDNWEVAMPEEIKHYDTVIHPQIVKTIEKICKMNPQMKLNIMDIGGGSGKLAHNILVPLVEFIEKVVVIDSSLKLHAEAQKLAAQHKGKLAPKRMDVEKLIACKEFEQSTDIVILCGVVALQVLEKGTALKLIKKCRSILRENGIIIAASLSPAIISSSEYEGMGYEVFNKTLITPSNRGPMYPPMTTNDFYILQKNKDK